MGIQGSACTSLLLVLCAVTRCLGTQQESGAGVLVCDARQGLRVALADCERLLPHSRTFQAISYETDVAEEQEALESAVGLMAETPVGAQELWEALDRCVKLRRYADISVHCAPNATLSFHARMASIVDQIHITGTLLGRDRYRHLYGVQAGDIFSEQAHREGVAAVVKALHEEGYRAATVTDDMVHDQTTKTVRIYLGLHQGHRYRINDVRVSVAATSGQVPRRALGLIEKAVHRVIKDGLLQSYVSEQLLDHEAEKIKQLLIDKGYFSHTIRLQDQICRDSQSVQLHFVITIGASTECVFEGNRTFSRDELMGHIMRFGSSVALIPGSLLAEELQEFYRQAGFWKATVQFRDDGRRWYFFITEGDRPYVTSCRLEGASSAHGQELADVLRAALGRHATASHDHLKQAIGCMMQRYLELGYWDAAVDTYDLGEQPDRSVELRVRVREGSQKMLERIVCDVPPLATYAQDLPQGVIEGPPIPFDVRILQLQKRYLHDRLVADGRLYAAPYPEITQDASGDILTWTLKGSPDVVTFGRTMVRGNGRVAAKVLLRELAYAPGDPWNPRKVDLTVARLRGLGVFRSVTLVPDDVSKPAPVKDLILEAIPDSPYEIRARIGAQGVSRHAFAWRGGASYKFGVSALLKNPAHQGDLLRFDGDLSRYMHDFAATYRLPRLFEQAVRTELRAFSSRYDQPIFIGSPEVLYRMSYAGALAGLGYWEGAATGGVNVGLAWLKLYAPSCQKCDMGEDVLCDRQAALMRALFINPRFLNTQTGYVCIEPSVMLNYLDSAVDPSSGLLTVASMKGMVPPLFRGAAFFKFLIEQSCFIPVAGGGAVTLGVRMRMGSVIGAPFDKVPPSERFYLGGSHSLRGYEADYAPPLHQFTSCSGCQCCVPIGGKHMVNGNIEVRFPLYRELKGVVFADGGSLSYDALSALVYQRSMVGSVGFGVRWHTIVGPLRFDIGWKIPKPPSTLPSFSHRSYAWFITLGHAF